MVKLNEKLKSALNHSTKLTTEIKINREIW